MSSTGQSVAGQTVPIREAPLRVYLLGPPRVEGAGRPLPIRRRQVRALLFRLATRFEVVDREHLCFLFWPDSPDTVARRKLSHLLTHLRRALPAPEVLQLSDDHLSLDSGAVWSDAAAFEQSCALLLPPQSPQQKGPKWNGPVAKALEQAAELYQGAFLTGFSMPCGPEYEAWAELERRSLERLYLESLTALVQELTARRSYEAAIAYAQRYLAIDDLAEEMHRCLIELFALVGDRGAALQQFERCVASLERELGVSPLPQTRAAYEVALRGRPVVQQPVPPPPWTTLPGLDAPLVGRDAALSQLEHSFLRVRSGHGQVVLISGEPGIGKSRLMQDFIAGLQGRATVAHGSGYETEQGLPFWPVLEALQPYLPTTDWTALGVDTIHLAEVARLSPGLRAQFPDLPAPSSLEQRYEQIRLFQALARLFLGLAAHQPPLVICLDDLQWLDQSTLSWLAYLIRHLEAAPILILGAYRSEDAVALAKLRAALSRLGLLCEITLEGLSVAEVLRLFHHLSGQSTGGEQFSQHLHRETGGNPFFLLETLRAMFEAGILWRAETGWSTGVDEWTAEDVELPLPDTVSEAIRDRLNHLTPQTYQVLEAGAIIGHQFSFDLVRQTSGRHETEVVDALDALMVRHILAEHGGKYRFCHDLIRAVVYHQLSYGRRRLLHRRAGKGLERFQPDDVAALARHFEHAEEYGRSAAYALQAGQAARAVFACDEARTYFDRALACLEREAGRLQGPQAIAANRRLRLDALDGRGWAFRLLGDMEAYACDSQEVARLAGLLGDQRTLARLRWREAYTHRWFCQYTEAGQAAETGCRLGRLASDPLVEAMCWREVGLAARAVADSNRAREALERALPLFVDQGAVVYEIHTLGNLSTLYLHLGAYGMAMDLARQALARCEAAGLPLERRLPLGDMGAAAVAIGDADLAQQCLAESLAIARRVGDRTQEIFCLGHLGWLYATLQQGAEALVYLRQGLEVAECVDSLAEQSWLLSGLAKAHQLGGNLAQAMAHGRRALELADRQGRVYDQELARRVLAGLEEVNL